MFVGKIYSICLCILQLPPLQHPDPPTTTTLFLGGLLYTLTCTKSLLNACVIPVPVVVFPSFFFRGHVRSHCWSLRRRLVLVHQLSATDVRHKPLAVSP